MFVLASNWNTYKMWSGYQWYRRNDRLLNTERKYLFFIVYMKRFLVAVLVRNIANKWQVCVFVVRLILFHSITHLGQDLSRALIYVGDFYTFYSHHKSWTQEKNAHSLNVCHANTFIPKLFHINHCVITNFWKKYNLIKTIEVCIIWNDKFIKPSIERAWPVKFIGV